MCMAGQDREIQNNKDFIDVLISVTSNERCKRKQRSKRQVADALVLNCLNARRMNHAIPAFSFNKSQTAAAINREQLIYDRIGCGGSRIKAIKREKSCTLNKDIKNLN